MATPFFDVVFFPRAGKRAEKRGRNFREALSSAETVSYYRYLPLNSKKKYQIQNSVNFELSGQIKETV